MANIITRKINEFKAKRNIKSANKIVNDIDSIVRNTINRNNIQQKDLSPKLGSRAIVGKLKKRFAPNRNVSQSGIHINRFNMSDLYTSYVGENLMKFSVDKYTEATIRNGQFVDSKNPTVVKYLNKRISEFDIVSGSSFMEFISDFMVSLILYGNVPIIKHRQENVSSGKRYVRWDGKKMKPIASLYVEDFRKLIIGDGPGNKTRYIRTPMDVADINMNMINPSLFNMNKSDILDGSPSMYNPIAAILSGRWGQFFRRKSKRNREYIIYDDDTDIQHVRYHHTPGEKIAMPPFWATLNDIDSLRRIEENIELLVYQYGHPILHAKVGDDKKPGSDPEVEDIRLKIENIEGNGFIATDNRVMLDMIGAENSTLRLEAYLEYFYRRVLTGLWLSEVMVGVGDTSNRSTSNTLDKLSQEKVMELQNIFSAAIQPILIELLAETGAKMGWILKPENIPSFKFHPVDLEGLIKKQSHILSMWQANMITNDEMRRETGKEPFSKNDLNNTYTYLHAIPLKKAGKGEMETPSSNKAKQNKLTPKNQHGKKNGPSESQNA